MSKIIKKCEDRKLANVVECDGEFYYVDSAYTFDAGYETMVFPCDERGKVSDWGDLYARWYASEIEMEAGHNDICLKLESLI